MIVTSDIVSCQVTVLNNGAAGRKCRTPSPYTVLGPDREGWPPHNTICSDTEREELEVSMFTPE
jgi:hypothetical protein